MRQSAVLADDYVPGRNETEAEIQELRDQIHRLRLAMEEAARLIWIKPTEAEKILSTALKYLHFSALRPIFPPGACTIGEERPGGSTPSHAGEALSVHDGVGAGSSEQAKLFAMIGEPLRHFTRGTTMIWTR